jgi:3-oxoadipate enol-lactonase
LAEFMPLIGINHTELYYQIDTVGTPSNQPTLVLANGIFQRVEAWEALMPYLEGLSVLRYDMRGQGRSAVPEGAYTPELHADDLEALLAALNIPNYSLLGLSNGGVVSQVFAARRPSSLHKLILLCTTSYNDSLIRAKVESWRLALEQGGTAARLKTALPWIWGRSFFNAHPELMEAAAFEQMLLSAPTVQAQLNLMAGYLSFDDLRPDNRNIAVPTLVLSGEDDLLFPPLYSQAIADSIEKAQHHILPKVGHVAPLEDTLALAQQIRSFLEVKP